MKKLLLLISLTLAVLSAQETGAQYLIVTHDAYYDALQPLVLWKTQKGMKAKIVKLSDIGTDSTQIRDYIINAYNNWPIQPEYLLLVGNKYQIPFPRYVHPGNILSYSDNYYANVTGDFHNELYHGRLWVSDTTQVHTVVAKILGYEKNPHMSDSLWFRKGVTIVNEYEPGGPYSDSVYWADARFAIQHMLNAGYIHVDSLSYYLGHDSSDVIEAINDGRSYILYRGIGSPDWFWPFQGIYPAQMTNGFKMPVVLSATCATVEGIGRNWLVAETPNQPKGIVGFFGATTSLYAAAEMRSALCCGTTASIFGDSSNLGKAAEAGRLNYYARFRDLLEYHSWTLLGDPELTMWTDTPKELVVGHNMHFSTGICTASVYVLHDLAPVPGALVCVMAKLDSSFYHQSYTDNNGAIQFVDTLHIPCDSVYFTVTGYNLRTYQNARPVYYSDGPYISLSSYRLADSISGNHDGIANPAEDIEVPFNLRNWGNVTAYGITATLSKALPDTFCTVYDTVKYVGNIGPLDSICVGPDGFNIAIDSNCPDLHTIALRLVMHDSNDHTWTSDFDLTVHAPIILYQEYNFPGNYKFTAAGDTNELFVELANVGSYEAIDVVGTLLCSDSCVTIVDSVASFGAIPPEGTTSNQADPFIISTNPALSSCHVAELALHVVSGAYSVSHNFTIYIGQKDYIVWDPDPNHSSGPTIHSCLAQLNFLGDYSETFPLDYLNIYKTLFTCLGINPNKYIIYDTSVVIPEIEQLLGAGGRMYLEGGDVWYLDPSAGGYSFAPSFHILPMWNSIGPCTGVSGIDGTFTQGMDFSYGGENSSIDRIDPTGAGILILSSPPNGYGCGVAANNQTLGLSLELGGLTDSIVPSTKAILIDSIMNYFGIPPTCITASRQFGVTPTMSLACYPNPARRMTDIRYLIPVMGDRRPTLRIYDATGRLIRDLSAQLSVIGHPSSVVWDGCDDLGRRLAQGVYFVHFQTSGFKEVVKTILLH